MKTISELQQDIRLVRKDLSKMDERLSGIDTELLLFKDSLQDDTNFKHIYDLAEAMPLIPHPIATMKQNTKSIYLGILLMTATVEDSISEQQLLHLQRMIMTDENRNRIDYYMGNLGKIQPDNVIFRLDDAVILSHANQLVLDMIIVAKLGKNCTNKTFGVIADISSILHKRKQDFIEICNVASAILRQNWEGLSENPEECIRFDSQYGYYLNELSSWKMKVDGIKRKNLMRELCNVLRAIEVKRK